MFIVTVTIVAQAPQGFNYQATVRNNTGALIINKSVSFKFNIIPTSANGTAAYSESQTVTTDDLGQVSLVIGKGTATTGTFATIDWATGTYYLGIELNTGNGFVAMGATQLLSVPYALYAKNSGNTMAAGTEKGQIMYWNGTSWDKLATGKDGKVLRWTNGNPTWENSVPNINLVDYAFKFDENNQLKLYLKTKILDDGGENITEQGIYYSNTNPVPTENDSKTMYDESNYFSFGPLTDNSYLLEYSNFLINQTENLVAGTKYYVRAYAVNSKGKGYSTVLTITSPANYALPTITTPVFSVIRSAVADVETKFDFPQKTLSQNSQIGFVWDPNPNPTILSQKKHFTFDSTIDKKIKTILENLIPNTKYYVRAFTSDGVTTNYSTEASFTTLPLRTPSLKSTTVSRIASTTASAGFTITINGGSQITNSGLVWGTSINPTILSNNGIHQNTYNNSNLPTTWEEMNTNFSTTISRLTPSTTYYVRSYATNSVGTAYGEEVSFTTLAPTAPVFNSYPLSQSIQNITTNSASIYTGVDDTGGSAITEQGYVWSTSTNPTTAIATKSIGSSANLTGLQPATTYYVRAYAINAIGTSYSNQGVFTTLIPTAPVFNTLTVPISVTINAAYVSSSYLSTGNSTITEQGFVWGTNTNPTTALTTKATGTSINLTGLQPATTYYVRAYAINAVGTTYSNEVTFTTLALTAPVFNTLENASTITADAATVASNIQFNGGSTVTQQGFVWSTSTNPTTALTTKSIGASVTITGLLPNTIYYLRAYAINTSGTSYSNEITFTTLALTAPVFNTLANASSVTTSSAYLTSSIQHNGGSTITQQGFVWNTSTNPTTALTTKTIGSFANLTALLPNTTYYVKAYAINANGTSYSNEVTFTTLALAAPILNNLGTPSSITTNSANVSSSVQSNGGSTITEQGLVWGTSTNPTTALTTKAMYVSSITGLQPATTYYVRAYATNAVGTSYSNERVFTTLALSAPLLNNITSPTSITANSASVSSSIQSNGGSTITEQGLVWGTNSYPTTALTTKAMDTSSITGLLPGTTYYVRAYAINATGTSYSNEVAFTTLATTAPVFSSDFIGINTIARTTAKLINVYPSTVNDGGSVITEKGIIWSTSPNPTTSLNTKLIGILSTTFTGLSANTTYYVRAYAINAIGTSYTNEVSFTTLPLSIPILYPTEMLNTSLTNNSVFISRGTIKDNGGVSVSEHGFVWSTSPNPTTALSTKKVNTIGDTLTGLLPSTTYYVRSYAINSFGTGYGEPLVFTTPQ